MTMTTMDWLLSDQRFTHARDVTSQFGAQRETLVVSRAMGTRRGETAERRVVEGSTNGEQAESVMNLSCAHGVQRL